MRIYYRGYVIDESGSRDPSFNVLGLRPEREPMVFKDSPRSAMRWIDREVIKQRVIDAGWLMPSTVSAE